MVTRGLDHDHVCSPKLFRWSLNWSCEITFMGSICSVEPDILSITLIESNLWKGWTSASGFELAMPLICGPIDKHIWHFGHRALLPTQA